MVETILVAAGVYILGWAAASWCFSGIKGPVPVPGRLRRDIRDGVFWPVWLLLFALIWLAERRRQDFENEFTGE